MKNKIEDFSESQILKLIESIGGASVAREVLSGKVVVKIERLSRIDENGCFLPVDQSEAREYNPEILSSRPLINYYRRLSRLGKVFPELEFASPKNFYLESRRLTRQLLSDRDYSGLLQGVWFPICLPKIKITDYGETFENVFLEAAKKAYFNHFKFLGFLGTRDLAGKIDIADSGHQRLIDKMSQGPVTSILTFPFRGISFDDARNIAGRLDGRLVFPGPIGITTAIATYPDILFKDHHSGMQIQCSGISFKGSKILSTLYLYVDRNGCFVCTQGEELSNYHQDMITGLLYLGE
ncbi:MAG: hypothetical protein NT165_01430 [Candidatus Falkowbacteria bacterium]|nr:hypothetical protein [Candidatus Falkowbacteria bacterium]